MPSITAPASNPAAPSDRPRTVSSELAAKLSLNAPKFIPPKPDGEKAPAPPDPRETDKSKNDIIRLPNYIVKEDKPPVFPNRELLTPEGKLQEALRRRPGFRILASDGVALAMLEEEHHLERVSEMNDLIGILQLGRDAEAIKVKSPLKNAPLRQPSWFYLGGPR